MKIVADPNIPYVREAFGPLGEVSLIPGRNMTAADVRDADCLLVRSVTPVNAALLDDSRVRFVATATIGFDHVDTAYLAARGIGFSSAAGCNANSVAEYVVAALLELAHRRHFRLRDKTLGVIGVGNVGRRVVRYAEALGMRVLQNDPPRQRAEGGPFVSLEHVVAEADILTLHVPLTKSGPDATYHLLEPRRGIVINSSRGAVLDNRALLTANLEGLVLDVWEGEPNILPELLEKVDIGTPHIAGYSFDGKVNGTRMIYEAACRFFGITPAWQPQLPPPPVPRIETDASGLDDEDALLGIIRRVYDIRADDAALRKVGPSGFDRLRAEYPVRREFFNTTLTLRGATGRLGSVAAALGFALLSS